MNSRIFDSIRVIKYLTNTVGRDVSVDEIAHTINRPVKFLQHTLSRLGKIGIVRAKKGPGGGFQLAVDPSLLTVQDLYPVLDKTKDPLITNITPILKVAA